MSKFKTWTIMLVIIATIHTNFALSCLYCEDSDCKNPTSRTCSREDIDVNELELHQVFQQVKSLPYTSYQCLLVRYEDDGQIYTMRSCVAAPFFLCSNEVKDDVILLACETCKSNNCDPENIITYPESRLEDQSAAFLCTPWKTLVIINLLFIRVILLTLFEVLFSPAVL